MWLVTIWLKEFNWSSFIFNFPKRHTFHFENDKNIGFQTQKVATKRSTSILFRLSKTKMQHRQKILYIQSTRDVMFVKKSRVKIKQTLNWDLNKAIIIVLIFQTHFQKYEKQKKNVIFFHECSVRIFHNFSFKNPFNVYFIKIYIFGWMVQDIIIFYYINHYSLLILWVFIC